MEVNIKNPSTRLLIERVDNGIIVYDVGEDNVVAAKIVYEIYFKDGVIDFQNMAMFLLETLEELKIPTEEIDTNRKLELMIVKIDPDKPALGEEEEDDDDDD